MQLKKPCLIKARSMVTCDFMSTCALADKMGQMKLCIIYRQAILINT